MNRVFIGYDPRQPVSYNILQHSICIRSSEPVQICPLIIEQLPIERQGLTPFTYTRYLVPWLCGFEGWALFLDADMLVMRDITRLFNLADDTYAVMCRQENQPRFEWPSAMLFNNAHPDNAKLTPEYIETADDLNGIKWTENIGELPKEWNYTVFYDEAPDKEIHLAHYTAGIPAFPETEGCTFSAEWHEDAEFAMSAKPWKEIMASSVHVSKVLQHMAVKDLRKSVSG